MIYRHCTFPFLYERTLGEEVYALSIAGDKEDKWARTNTPWENVLAIAQPFWLQVGDWIQSPEGNKWQVQSITWNGAEMVQERTLEQLTFSHYMLKLQILL